MKALRCCQTSTYRRAAFSSAKGNVFSKREPAWIVSQILIICVVWIWATAADASDWPTYRHDSSRIGRTADSLSEALNLEWTFCSLEPPKASWPGPGGRIIEELHLRHRMRFDDVFHPVIAAGKVFFGSSVDHHIHAFDLASRKPLWRFATGGPVRLAPTYDNGKIYCGSDDGLAYCLDADSGRLIWKRRAALADERILARGQMTSRWPVRTGVLVDDNVAYFGAGTFPHENVFLLAVDAQTGQIIWRNDAISQQDAGRSDLTPQGYLLASQKYLFVPSGRTLPAAFDRATGQFIHKQTGGGKQVGGTQVLLANENIYTVGDHNIMALKQSNGEILGQLPARQITLDQDIAFIATGNEIDAVDHRRYGRAFQNKNIQSRFAELKTELLEHPHLALKGQIKTVQSELDALDHNIRMVADSGKKGPIDIQTLRVQRVAKAEELANLTRQMEATASAYQAKRHEAESLIGVLWRVDLPHDSALILAADKLIAGGDGEVVVLDTATGQTVWKTAVDGEARGLAVADGHLVVSTTDGRVYCFGNAGSTNGPILHHQAQPMTDPYPADAWSATYERAAEKILEETGIHRGYCLVLGSDEGRLAFELARRTDPELKIYCVEEDPDKVNQSRNALVDAGLYGARIIVEPMDSSCLPFPNYFANLVVSDTLLRTGRIPGDPKSMARHVKPVGGVICLGLPPSRPVDEKTMATEGTTEPETTMGFETTTVTEHIQSWIAGTDLEKEGAQIHSAGGWTCLTRGPIPGTASWTHPYGNPGNTACVDDPRIQNGLSVLWYGDPGPSKMTNRHLGAAPPVSIDGRLIIQGESSLMAYDAYNGLFLWELPNLGAFRIGLKGGLDPGNLVAGDHAVFNSVGHYCWQIDVATGRIIRKFSIPDASENPDHEWGYLAYVDGKLFGTSTRRQIVIVEGQNPQWVVETDKLFAIDATTGSTVWTYEGKSISHMSVVVADDRIIFIDSSITPEQRQSILEEDKGELVTLTGEARQNAEARLKKIDVRLAVALDMETGATLWSQPVDVTDCSEIGIGGGKLALLYKNNYVVLCGANANGHYWKQYLAGEFKRRRLVVLDASTGRKVWAKDANYRHRPIIVGDRIIAEPWAFDLASGKQITRTHPWTGDETAWNFIRPGHHCGALSATENMLFFRSGCTAYYDLNTDSGTRHFGGHRLGCWINAIPAGGLVLVPEASAGCACLFSLTSTIVFEPRENQQDWAVYAADGPTTPVHRMAINLGGPGDRRDASGMLWIGYPRPWSRPGIDLPLELQPQFVEQGRFEQFNPETYPVAGTDRPWLFASGARGLKQCTIPLRDPGQPPAEYTVRLSLVADAAPDSENPNPLQIRLQNQTVAKDLDVAAEAGGPMRALVLEYTNIPVRDRLLVELILPSGASNPRNQPILAGIEVLRP
ncbi:MAG: PQQ-binding-like beta-propeller repeat protein [Pirellulales bacterium]|nr:PQQ-binding-like beta-propeller repeat protein [Pirellulales bacterium]